MDIISYAKSRRYTDESLDGAGALKGAPCEIESIVEIDRGHRITFKWVGTSGTEYTDTLDVMNGLGIKSVQILDVNDEKHLIITYDDDTTEDAGKLPSYVAYPEITAPSATLSTSNDTLLECGSTQNTTMVIAFDRGKIDPAYGTSGYRSGVAQSYTLDGTTQASGTFSVTVSEAKTSYQGSVAHAAGEQPKDSEGGNYDSSLPAGNVSTNSISFEFVNAIWANASDITSVAKQPLVSVSDGEAVIEFAPQTAINPAEFHIPSALTVNGIYAKNPFSDMWEDVLAEFDMSNTTHENAGGATVNYKKYVDNRGYAATGRTIKVTWA